MRNNHKIILAGAVALATVFTACQREQAVDNPNYNAEEGTVKTQFVLNVATANTPTTKQSAENTQATTDKTFRGMEEAALLAYKLDYNLNAATGGGSHVFDMTPAKATATRKYNLGNLLAVDEIQETQSRRVMELALPVGTNALLFYGKAPKGSLTNKAAGSVTISIAENANDTEFTIGKRMTDENRVIFNETTDLIATCMNMLSNAALKQYTADVDAKLTRDLRYAFYWPINNTSDVLNLSSLTPAEIAALPADGTAGTGAHAGQTFHIGETSWSALGEQYIKNNDTDTSNDAPLTPNQEILGQAYAEFTTIRTVGGNTELRAGSGSAMQAVVSDLYSVANRVSNATPSFWEGETAKLLASRIKDIIETCFTGTAGALLSYRSVGSIKDIVAQYVLGKEVTNYSHVLDLAGFPGNIDMPNGSSIITFDNGTKTWSYLTSIPAYGMSGGAQDVNKYLFPAELMYFGNSPVRVTDDAHENTHYPNTVGTWDTESTWTTGDLAGATGWTKDGAVKSTTRSVAMQMDVNYGTALLESKVKYGAATLKDNNHAIQHDRTGADEPDIEIPVEGNTFRLTGIIVGGQIYKVGWNYVNKGSTFDYMVYDNDIPNGSIPVPVGTESTPNYTLVWDNWNAGLDNDAQTPVYVALELYNNAKDFWGNANRVRKGGTFYLVGKLDPAGKAFPSRSATNYKLPPYNDDATGTTVAASRVFIQDFVTKVSFTIGENSLKKAYVTVPDLRSSEISLALSVDIKWETGLDFGNVVLGQ